MTKMIFTKPFTQQEAIPEAGIERAVDILKTGRLHRYNLLPDEAGEAASLEMEYARLLSWVSNQLTCRLHCRIWVGISFRVAACPKRKGPPQ